MFVLVKLNDTGNLRSKFRLAGPSTAGALVTPAVDGPAKHFLLRRNQ
jgi:hypothetical protein